MKLNLEMAWESARAHWGYWLAAGGFLTLLFSVATNFDFLVEKIVGWEMSERAMAMTIAVLGTAFVGTVFVLIALQFAASNKGETDRLLNAARTEVRHLRDQAVLIVNRLYPARPDSAYRFLTASYALTIDKDGGALIVRSESVAAFGQPLVRWTDSLSVGPTADAVESFADLKFGVASGRPDSGVAYLVVKDEPRSKRVALFPLPFIDVNETEPRLIETTAYWPGMFRPLVENGRDRWTWSLFSGAPVETFVASFYFHPALGDVNCEFVGANPGTFTLSRVRSENGWAGWKFMMSNAPAQKTEYVFDLSIA